MKLVLPLVFLLLAACAPPPRSELQAARMAVSRAYYAGAEELASEEYRRAAEALQRGEELVREQNFDQARELLPQAESHARQALVRARLEKDRLDRLRIEEEAKTRQTLSTPQPQAPKPLPTPSSPPPAAVRPRPAVPVALPSTSTPPPALSRYTVGDSETLWNISAREEVYGDPLLWPLLYQANRDQIRDPRRLYRGQVLTIPRGLSQGDLEEVREKARRSDIFPVDRSRPSLPRNP